MEEKASTKIIQIVDNYINKIESSHSKAELNLRKEDLINIATESFIAGTENKEEE